MAKNANGLSRDLIIHPGVILKDILDGKNLTQKELHLRTGVSEKHISNIINGTKNISPALAKKLEYALCVEASFWLNLQAIYDDEMLEYEKANDITEEEIVIASNNLKDILKYLIDCALVRPVNTKQEKVIALRSFLKVANLTYIPSIAIAPAAFRVGVSAIDIYVIFAWIKICEALADQKNIDHNVDIERLKSSIGEIKELMFVDAEIMKKRLTDIFADCGIAFNIVKHFKGAPVQGFIYHTKENRLMLSMTIRNSFADIFWFTLFHEIWHIINDDFKQQHIDYVEVDNEVEQAADLFAQNTLIEREQYCTFVKRGQFDRMAILEFSQRMHILPCILVGRLQKESILGWNEFSDLKLKYKWSEC